MNDRPGNPRRPRKAPDLELNEVLDGYVVYQPARDRVHHLNRTAVLVLELCTGEHGVDEIAAIVQDAFELPERPTAEISACLTQLLEEQLVA